MSVIAVGDVPIKMSLIKFVKTVAARIKGYFKALNFGPPKNGFKICYLKLSPKLDPLQVIRKMNAKKFGKLQLKAFMPESVPKLQVASKPKTLTLKMKRAMNIRLFSPRRLVGFCHGHIMREMQMKYAGLNSRRKDFGENTYRKLIQEVGRVVYQRLAEVMKSGMDTILSTFALSKAYRKKHPHFGDFQLIISTLHQLQDAEGKPRIHIQENELTSIRVTTSMIDNIPVEKMQGVCNKYIEKITRNVLTHVKNLKKEVLPDMDPTEAAAKIKVREQIGKLTPYLSSIIKQVVNKQFVPDGASCHAVLIYGEPTIPNKQLMKPFLRRHRPITVMRDPNLFNLLTVRVPRTALMSLLAVDGTLVGVHDNNRDRWHNVLSEAQWGDPQGQLKHPDHDKHLYGQYKCLALRTVKGNVGNSKLTIRPCDVPVFKISLDLYKDESEKLSDELDPIETEAVNDAEDGGRSEEWTEEW